MIKIIKNAKQQQQPSHTKPSHSKWKMNNIILRWLFFNRRCAAFFSLWCGCSLFHSLTLSLARSLPLSHSIFVVRKNDVSELYPNVDRKKSRSFGLIWYAVAYIQLIDCGGIFAFSNAAPSKTMKEKRKTMRKRSIVWKRSTTKYQRFLMKNVCLWLPNTISSLSAVDGG